MKSRNRSQIFDDENLTNKPVTVLPKRKFPPGQIHRRVDSN